MQVLLDSESPMQKRVAAYLVLMKDPQPSELAQLAAALPNEPNDQAKSFVISHVTNILSSTEPETQELRQKILDALQGNEVGPIMDPTKFSSHFKIGSVEGNVVFEGTSYLPKEVMLDMTLKAFGFDIDMVEIGMEGKGFEPTVEALFGENGFFPDTVLKAMYFVSDNMPLGVSEVLQSVMPALKRDRMKRQATQNLLRDIGRNLNKLVRDLKTTPSPEAMVYLRLLGNELGYLKTNEMEEMVYSAAMMIDSLMKMFPADLLKALISTADNAVFAHYIFMDNEFFLPTATGVPLRIALSGTFTPGVQGGLKVAADLSEIVFKPSAAVEFDTRIGAFLPEYVDSVLEMHTSLFHESGIAAKVSFEGSTAKLTIPAPMHPVKVLKITNYLVAVSGSTVWTIPPVVTDKVDVSECTPFFAGIKYCSALQYTDASSSETAPYFPFTGDSKFAVELHPTGEVSEYSATLAYELLREGEEGRQKVDSVKFVLRAEGAEPTEARAIVKYNRRKNVLTADLQIPDYDLEAGLRLGVVDGNTKGKGTHSISLDLIHKNIPQLSLVGRASLKAMQEGMLQVQVLVPSFSADAALTANLKLEEDLQLELESNINLQETTSRQIIAMKYGTGSIEVELKSDVKSDILNNLPFTDNIKQFGNDVLELPVGKTDKTVSQLIKTFVEAANDHLEVYGADIPFIQNLRVPEISEISLPETLFLNTEAKAVYYFNDEHFTISVPLPLGGKSTEELNFPPALTTPHISLLGLSIMSTEIPIPELFVPESLTCNIPLFGKAEISAMMKSNLYNMDALIAVGKDVVETPSFSAKFDVTGSSPIDILSIKMEGSGMLAITDAIKANLKSSLVHQLIEANVNIVEEVTIADKISVKSSSKIEANSPLGVNIALEHTGVAGVSTEEISAESNLEGTWEAGPLRGKATATQAVIIAPFKPEAKIDSNVLIDSRLIKAQNTIAATFSNSELSLTSDTNALALGLKINNKAEASAGAGEVVLRIETNTDQSENRVYSLLTASLDVNGLAVNSDATVKLLENEAIHKAALKMSKDGWIASGTTTLQSPLALENTFSAELAASKASLTINNKAAIQDIKVDNANNLIITLSSLDFNSKAEAVVSEYASYTHDITIDLKPDTATANVNNNLKLLGADVINEAHLKAELYKIDLTGNLKAIYGEEEVKHAYEVNYADLAASAKCSTTGKLLGTHMSQNTELEVIGLAARIANDARFNSQPVRFDQTIRCSVAPFDLNLDAIFNADGEITMYGKHSAQLYGKVLLKAQPLAIASSHECRASVTQQLDSGLSIETTLDNKMDNVLSLQEQKSNLRIKAKVNEHTLSQDLSIYNTAERIGLEASATILTNILNGNSEENQEVTLSGFLKYDKNTDSHALQIPLVENLPALLESIKGLVVLVGETLQGVISNEEVKAAIEALPQYAVDFVSQLNLEEKINQVKQYLSDLTQEYAISMEDVEAVLTSLKAIVEKLLFKLRVHIQRVVDMMKNIIVTIPQTFVEKTQELLDVITEEFDIRAMVIYVIDTVRDMIERFDLEKLEGSSIEFLNDIDTTYKIRAKLQIIMSLIKDTVEVFDMQAFVGKLTNFISSFNFEARIDELVSLIPTEIFSSVADTIKDFVNDFDVLNEISNFYAYIRELIVKFDVEEKFQVIFEKVVKLIKQLKLDETVQALAKMLNDADISSKLIYVFQGAIDYLKVTEVKDIIAELNGYIHTIEQRLDSVDYNEFVAYINPVIIEFTAVVNDLIESLELQQKLEALRDLANLGLSFIRGTLAQLREIRITEIVQNVKDTFNQVVLDNLMKFAENIKREIGNPDIKIKISSYLQLASEYYTEFITFASDIFSSVATVVKKPKIVQEVLQIIEGLIAGLQKAEMSTPTFTIPLTDLIVPSIKFSIDMLDQFEVPQELHVPEFTILGFHTVKATTITMEDIQQGFIDLVTYLFNLQMKLFDSVARFESLTMSYIPTLPEFSLPGMTIPQFSFPTLPQVQAEKLVTTLQLPPFKLPKIPTEVTIPALGKVSYEMKVITPIYTLMNVAEIQNSLDLDRTPQLTAFLTSQSTSTSFEVLNFNLDSTARIAIPTGGLIAAETFKFTHSLVMVDHDVSLTFSDFSAQVSAKTTVKSTTEPYNAEFLNEAFLATNGGISATMDTSYKHVLDLPVVGLTGETSVTQKAVARQEGASIMITIGNQGTATLNSLENSLKSDLQVSVNPSLHDMKLELKATQSTDLTGVVNGALNNVVDITLRPREVLVSLQNKGNSKVVLHDALTVKIDLQNDYSAAFRPDTQHVNTVVVARLNQCKAFWNFTVENTESEVTILAFVEGEANLDFLTKPITIPEITIPLVDLQTPAIRDLNLYDQIGLRYILTPTEQTVNMGAKIMYQKRQDPAHVGMTQLPPLGNLITDVTFKSAIINLNVNAGLSTEDDIVLRLGATTASVYESLEAKLDGTTSLTTTRGIKLANSLSLENPHIQGTHDSTISLGTEMLEPVVSVATVAKIALPILNLEANQNLVANTKTKPNAASTWTVKGDFNIPVIRAVGKAEADHKLKLEGTFDFVSVESSTAARLDGTVLEDYLLLGVVDNEANVYLNSDGLRSNIKLIADTKLEQGTTKVIGLEVNENLEVEASLSRVYAVLKLASTNEANLFDFSTNGKHTAQATVDLVPAASLTADIEIDLSQPTSLGDFTIFEKIVAEVTAATQKISTNTKFISPVYTTNLSVEFDGNAPVFRVDFRSSATSAIIFLEYDLDTSVTLNLEEDAGVRLTGKGLFTHTDLTMDFQHILSHTLSVDITSPAFTDINVRHAFRKDGISCSISIPSTGFLGLQLHGRIPTQMNIRLYSRYASDPGKDVEIINVRASVKDTYKMNLKMVINMEVPDIVLSGLQERLPAMTSSMSSFNEKYHLSRHAAQLNNHIIYYIEEAHNIAYDHAPDLSHVSILFRNTVVQYHETLQVLLDATINFLRETQVRLPGSQETSPLIEVLNMMTTSITTWLEKTFNFVAVNTESAFNVVIDTFSEIQVTMPTGEVMASAKVIDNMRERVGIMFDHILSLLKDPQSLDLVLENLGGTLRLYVDKFQDLVDNTLRSDALDALAAFINAFYKEHTRLMKTITKSVKTALDPEFIKATIDYIIDICRSTVNQFNQTISDYLNQATAQIKFYVRMKGNKLEMNF
ncbi:apolipoprotein B-100-like [Xyrichtys novacula]|nr:apolipoprotein B-100-like [Xyrichtys novacula]